MLELMESDFIDAFLFVPIYVARPEELYAEAEFAYLLNLFLTVFELIWEPRELY